MGGEGERKVLNITLDQHQSTRLGADHCTDKYYSKNICWTQNTSKEIFQQKPRHLLLTHT